MSDVETESYWSHITGGAIEGPLVGESLKTVPVVQTTWGEWQKEYPDTWVLKKDKQILSSRYKKYFDNPERTGLFRTFWLQDRLPGKELVLGTKIGPFAIAVTEKKLDQEGLIESDLGDSRLIYIQTEDGGEKAFKAKAGNKLIHFKLESGKLMDVETNSTWDKYNGICLSGPLNGEKLEELTTTPIFWFAWSNFYPNTKVID